jgi:3-methylcrotonyl-CoA carboxylase alpha subunit
MTIRIVTIGANQSELSVERDGIRFTAGDRTLELVRLEEREAEIRIDGRTYFVPFVLQGTKVSFWFDGETYVADVAAQGTRARTRHRDHSLEAPMPGVIVKIFVSAGDVVAKGTPLVALEAMKMEHQIVAGHDGRVEKVNCREGELVQPGFDLITLNDAQ